MKHLGDITKINGAEIEPVDVITFGSPCQDLSVAGKRAGMKHAEFGDSETTRSGLFMEAARIIKEMRSETDGEYPTYAVWENVPGAFSSNHGEDFRAVLEELCRIKEPAAVIPEPPNGKWNTSGAIVGNRWSLAWRVLDAQFWRVPQRRRRISLVMDFRGQSAPEILFVRKGLSRDTAEGGKARKRIAGDIAGGIGGTGRKTSERVNCQPIYDPAPPLDASYYKGPGERNGIERMVVAVAVHQNADGEVRAGNVANTLNTNSNASGRNAPLVAVYDARGNGDGLTAPTMTGDHQNRITDYTGIICMATQQGGAEIMIDKCPTLTASAGMSGSNQPVAAIPETYQKVTGPLMANSHPGSYTGQDVYSDMLVTERHCVAVRIRYRVRRLTPLECERLQGYPDYWTVLPVIEDMTDATYDFWCQMLLAQAVREEKARMNEETETYEIWRFVQPEAEVDSEADPPAGYWKNTGKPYKDKTKQQMIKWYNSSFADPDSTDSVRYKALGNSIALPPHKWVLKRISAQFERDATLGSLFDGIGGFPLIWERLNGAGTARWASEIEPFPIAVTKYRLTEV